MGETEKEQIMPRCARGLLKSTMKTCGKDEEGCYFLFLEV